MPPNGKNALERFANKYGNTRIPILVYTLCHLLVGTAVPNPAKKDARRVLAC